LPTESIAARYLEEFGRPVLPLPESPFAKLRFAGRYLSRPVFLDAGEVGGLERDLSLVRSALRSLPYRVLDGGLMAFARAVGMTEPQAECVLRSMGKSAGNLTELARADLYKDASGFRLLEWNLGSTIGGAESVDMCRALAAVPGMASFLAREGLTYADTETAILATLRSETGHPEGTKPVVALVDTPGIYPKTEAVLRAIAARWLDHGLAADVGHLGQLARSGGRLCLRGEPVDVVYRVFTVQDALDHLGDGLLEPLLSAVELGEVVMFTPLDAELYGSKGALALLSDPAGQVGLTADENDACDRLLPWTRRVQAGEAVLEDGSTVDLMSYALEHQNDLVLKPSLSYGGNGVLVGTAPGVTPEIWRTALAGAADGAHVLQRLVRPTPELFPSQTPGSPAAWNVAWGVFTTGRGYAGAIARAVPAEAGEAVVNLAQGALLGCCFHSTVTDGRSFA
jgi:hypothetical protein